MSHTILVVEDEKSVRDLLISWLDDAGYEPLAASDGVEGLKMLYHRTPELVVADLRMPRMDGFEFCHLVREICHVPIMILSGLNSEEDKVKGLSLGADEYVVKPVGMDEFLARVAALLRRQSWVADRDRPENRYSDDLVTIDYGRHEVRLNGTRVDLTPIEFKLLNLLVGRRGETCPLEEIKLQIWESPHYSSEVVRWHVASLRSKIEQDPRNPLRILTVWGVGYRYEPALGDPITTAAMEATS